MIARATDLVSSTGPVNSDTGSTTSFTLPSAPTALAQITLPIPNAGIDQLIQGLQSNAQAVGGRLLELAGQGASILPRALKYGPTVFSAVAQVLLNAPGANPANEEQIVAQIRAIEEMQRAFPDQLELTKDGPLITGLRNRVSGITVIERAADGTYRFAKGIDQNDLSYPLPIGQAPVGVPSAAFAPGVPGSLRLPSTASAGSLQQPASASTPASPAPAAPQISPEQRIALMRQGQAAATVEAALQGLGQNAQAAMWEAIGARYWSDVDNGRRSGTPADQQSFLAGLYNMGAGRWTNVMNDIAADAAGRLTARVVEARGVPPGERQAYAQAIQEWADQFVGQEISRELNGLAALAGSNQTWAAITARAQQILTPTAAPIVTGPGGVISETPGSGVQPEDVGVAPTGLRPGSEPTRLPEGLTTPPRPEVPEPLSNEFPNPGTPPLVPNNTVQSREDRPTFGLTATSFPNIGGPESALPGKPASGTEGAEASGQAGTTDQAQVELTAEEREQATRLARFYEQPLPVVEGIMSAAKQVITADPTRMNPELSPERDGAYDLAMQVLDLLYRGHPYTWALEAGLKLDGPAISFAKEHASTPEQLREVVSSVTSLRHTILRDSGGRGNDNKVRNVIELALQRAAKSDDPLTTLADTAEALAGVPSGAVPDLDGYAALIRHWPLDAIRDVFSGGRFDAAGMASVLRAFPQWNSGLTSQRLDEFAVFLRNDFGNATPQTIARALHSITDEASRQQMLTAVLTAAASQAEIAVRPEESGRIFAERVAEAATDLDGRMTAVIGALGRLQSGRHSQYDINEITSPANQTQLGIALIGVDQAYITDGSVPEGLANDDLSFHLNIGLSLETLGGVSRNYRIVETSGDAQYTKYRFHYRNGSDGNWTALEPHKAVELPPGSSVRYRSPATEEWTEIPLP